jgi:hypothetical protein
MEINFTEVDQLIITCEDDERFVVYKEPDGFKITTTHKEPITTMSLVEQLKRNNIEKTQ